MLALDKLENVETHGDKITARCPACARDGGDRKGVHLALWPATGKFACAATPNDTLHRRVIWALAGSQEREAVLTLPERRRLAERRQAEIKDRQHRARLTDAAARQKAAILRDYAWPVTDILTASPHPVKTTPNWRDFLFSLFQPQDILWIGEKCDSGQPHHAGHFRTLAEWLAAHRHSPSPPGPLVCPDTFNAGVHSRAGVNVVSRPYLVVEADAALGFKPSTAEERDANIAANLALIRWLRDACRWHLCAVLHTGGKSCHGWFCRPPDNYIEELKAIAPAWGLDASVFAVAHPVRLPGVRHEKTGHKSGLLYLATPSGPPE